MNGEYAPLDSSHGVSAADFLPVLAPRPRSLEQTGLSPGFATEFLAKHLHMAGVVTARTLSGRTALAGPVVEEIIERLRDEGYVEVRGGIDGGGLRYALTDRGRALALDALGKSGYAGQAPVPLQDYVRVVRAQSVHQRVIARDAMETLFSDIVLDENLLDQLGPALHSGRPIFVYGPPGAGKTYVMQRVPRVLDDSILIPHAIAVGDTVIQFFDPVYHHPIDDSSSGNTLLFDDGHDLRYARCERPVVITGGELTLDMLELSYDSSTRQYQAPLQLKANNGLYLIDDLGRQRVHPADLLNRWIVPMEERRDFLSLGSGEHFPVPFEVILVFSTNLNPLELADEAFLRRLGYKIRFTYLSEERFEAIWRQFCDIGDLDFDDGILQHVVENHFHREQIPMLACHPRDLIGLALDRSQYRGNGKQFTREDIDAAWESYFVRPVNTQ